ncbi:MAG: septum formation initiator family protein [Bacteroidales bacterium]|nr:septum formation initiator family protein [Bacteroidales bacterium]
MASVFKNIWDRSKDGSKKEQRGFIRFVIVATAIFLVILLVKKDSVIRWVQTGFELRRQKREIEYYQEEIRKLDSQIDGLSNNRDTLEAFARETYGFTEPGDDVYLVE